MIERQIIVVLPVLIVSEPNLRGHWSKRARRAKAQREAVHWSMHRHQPPGIDHAPITIRIERCGRGKLDDDNLAAGAKAVRDGVADWLDIDDGSQALRWVYEQRVDRKLNPHTTVTVTWRENAP